MEPCVTRFYARPRHRAVTVAPGRYIELGVYRDQVRLRYSKWPGVRVENRVIVITACVFIDPGGYVDACVATEGRITVRLDAPAIPSALLARWLSFLPRLWMTKMYQPMYDWMAEELPAPYCFWPSDPLRVFRELAPGYVFLEDEG